MQGRILFLGTGGSLGVPVIGCSCLVCSSADPKNRRMRSSAVLQIGEKVFLIDAGPDFRSQALKYQINRLDGFLLTHAHYDHLGGLDDMKVYQHIQQRKLPCLMSKETFAEVKVRYHYFIREEEGVYDSPFFSWHLLEKGQGDVLFEGVHFTSVSYYQMGMKVSGFRVGNLAYISDIKIYEEEILQRIQDVDILVVSALRHTSSPMHFSVEEAVAFARKVNAKRTFFTHVSHELDHATTNASLPKGFEMAYDGMEVLFSV